MELKEGDLLEQKKLEKNKGGRPLKEIPKKEFESLCALQCTKLEICAFFDITDKTLESWCKRNYKKRGFSDVFKEKRGKGHISLRRAQFRLAENNATMAIWLGKQYLGQSDEKNIEIVEKVVPTVITGSEVLEN